MYTFKFLKNSESLGRNKYYNLPVTEETKLMILSLERRKRTRSIGAKISSWSRNTEKHEMTNIAEIRLSNFSAVIYKADFGYWV